MPFEIRVAPQAGAQGERMVGGAPRDAVTAPRRDRTGARATRRVAGDRTTLPAGPRTRRSKDPAATHPVPPVLRVRLPRAWTRRRTRRLECSPGSRAQALIGQATVRLKLPTRSRTAVHDPRPIRAQVHSPWQHYGIRGPAPASSSPPSAVSTRPSPRRPSSTTTGEHGTRSTGNSCNTASSVAVISALASAFGSPNPT